MVRRFCWIATTLAVIFALSSIGWSREKPDYLKEKEMMAKPETAEKRDKSMQAPKIKDLTQRLEELKAKLERLPAGSDEDARHYQERIAEIQMQIAELREESKAKTAGRKAERGARKFQESAEQLKVEIEEAKAHIHELERTNPDSPRLRELRQYVKERQKMLGRLVSQSRRPPRPEARRQMQLKIFQLKHIDVEAAFGVVEPFITPNGRGIVVPVFHTNSLIIRDTPNNLRDIETIIKHIDVEGKPEREKVSEKEHAFREEMIVQNGESIHFSFVDASGKKVNVEISPSIVEDNPEEIRFDIKLKDESRNILSTPTLLTKNREPATFSRGSRTKPHYSITMLPEILENGEIKLIVEGMGFRLTP